MTSKDNGLDARRPTQDELHAYVDGHLSGERRAAVEAHLQVDSEDAARVRDYRRINEELKRLYAPVLGEAVPDRLRGSGTRNQGFRAVAAVAWLAVGLSAGLAGGVGGGWWMWGDRGGSPSPMVQLAQRATVAHAVYSAEVRHPVEVGMDQRDHLLGWLSNRLGEKVTVPDLEADGYALIGGRLLPGEEGPAAQFMYERPDGDRLTLYVKTGDMKNRQTAFRVHDTGGGLTAIYWIDGPFGYALSGTLDRAQLETIAHRVYEQLNP